jgi:hypothetical protein
MEATHRIVQAPVPSRKRLHHRSYRFCDLRPPPPPDADGVIKADCLEIPIRRRKDAVRVIKAAWAYGQRNSQRFTCEVDKETKALIRVWRVR